MPYIGKSPSAGVRQRYQYTATAGQTTFSGADLSNLTLNYVDNNFVDVFQNGVLLKGGGTDYTATSGTSVVLATGASVSDVIEIIVYDVFSVGNFFNRTDSDSRYALNEGGVVFNETSADVDFRVESNNNINMLHVDGGSDVVTVGGLVGTAGNEDAGYGPLQIGNTADSNPIVQFLSTTSGANTIHFGDAVSGAGRYAGYQIYDHSNNHMRFGTGGNDNLRLTNTVSGTTSEFSNPFAIESHPIMAIRTESSSGANHDTYYDFPVDTNGGCYVIAFSNHDQSPGSYGIWKNFQVAHNATNVSTQASEAYGGNGSVTATKPSNNVLRITFDKSDTSNSSGGYSTVECVVVIGANPF